MDEDEGVRFLFPSEEGYYNFVYRPPNSVDAHVQNATVGVKFSQGIHILDPWGFALRGKTRWQRMVFRLKHPIVYSKRWFSKLYRKVRRFFIKDKMRPF